jgi:uncharacterized RDD family membrane protein YckC
VPVKLASKQKEENMSTGIPPDAGLEATTAPISVEFVGFWRRVAAFTVDALVLGCVGAALGVALGNWLVGVGQWGRLIGVGIAGAYLVPANSSLFGGQTIGMRLLKTRVQTLSGELLSPGRSAVRYLVFAVPYFCNGVFLTLRDAPHWVEILVGVVLGTILVIGILGNTYLLMFNRPSRRLLHDLVTRSVVVKVASPRTAVQAPVALVHLGAFAAIVVAIVLGALWLAQRVGSTVDLKALERAQAAVERISGVVAAGINDGTFTMSGRSSHVLTITVRVVNWPSDEELAAAAMVAAATTGCSTATAFDTIRVVLNRGFDIGIATVNRQKVLSKSPTEWCSGAVPGNTPSAGGVSTPVPPER